MTYRIAITGPESTGKSELSARLAEHFDTVWAPEHARIYLKKLDRPYRQDDLLQIARGQKKQEEILSRKANKYLFRDTEMLVIKIWSEFKYGNCHSEVLKMLGEQAFDLYLLMNIDLPWQQDSMREHPRKRKELFNLYHEEMIIRGYNFETVSGMGESRFRNALKAIKTHLNVHINGIL